MRELPPFEKAVPDEEAPTEVGASCLERYARRYRPTAALLGRVRFPRIADLRVRRWRHMVGEWPLRLMGFGRILSTVR
jgi:hypothetical protein